MFIRIKDIMIHYQISGSGEPLILLHGNGEDLSVFDKQMECFAKKYQVIAIDTRGHGESERGGQPFTFDTFANDVIGLMDFSQIPKAHILGFSDGGNTALHIALKYPQRVKSLIVVGANLFPTGLKMEEYFSVWFNYLWLGFRSIFYKKMKKRKEIWSLMVFQPNLTFPQISSIQLPTLVFAGENDMVKESHTRKIATAITYSQLQILPGADHFLLFNQTEKANKVIQDFLNNI